MVSGSISLLCSRFFSPFPHGTGSLSVSGKYLALTDGPAGFTQDFSCPVLLRILNKKIRKVVYGIITLYDRSFQNVPLSHIFSCFSPTTPTMPKQCRFGLIPVRSPLLRESLLFSFPMGTKMFQFPTFAFLFTGMMTNMAIGLPHSEIRGSSRICQSPRLIAAYHVLRRLPEPRHPPCALCNFFFAYPDSELPVILVPYGAK